MSGTEAFFEIVYVEHRAWILDSSITFPEEPAVRIIDVTSRSGGIFIEDCHATVSAWVDSNRPSTADNAKTGLRLTFGRKETVILSESFRDFCLRALSEKDSTDSEAGIDEAATGADQRKFLAAAPGGRNSLILSGLEFIVLPVGHVIFRSSFTYLTDFGPAEAWHLMSDFEPLITNWVTDFRHKVVEPLIDEMSSPGVGLIKKPNTYRWGVPGFLDAQGAGGEDNSSLGHDVECTFTFTSHYFFNEGDALYAAAFSKALDESAPSIAPSDEKAPQLNSFEPYVGWYSRVWLGPNEIKVREKLDVELLFLIQTNILTSANNAYAATLRGLAEIEETPSRRRAFVSSDEIRYLVNINNWQYLTIRFIEREYYLEQRDLIERMRKATVIGDEIENFRAAEEAVIRGVEGLEAATSRRVGQVIEMAAIGIALLTIFSAANDLFALAKPSGDFEDRRPGHPIDDLMFNFGAPFNQVTWVLFFLTVVVIAIGGMVVFKQPRRRPVRPSTRRAHLRLPPKESLLRRALSRLKRRR
ncbi:hypothetical protein [Siccirubricoccus sp. G192]|uniref:hypothetical protein n=1 Tax=Siccirubricoccus sp. G192 TaxID=2849651 RepID=UPI001C2B99FB|nr:hypothetical protein [Siccirubricoccus sp. G192]MBV1796858.1 hypothetical protein [Siccirubricoccus sp. G192]